MLSVFGLLLMIVAVLTENLFWKRAAVLALVGAALFAVPAFLSGEGAEHVLERIGTAKATIKPHERSAKLAFGAVLVTGGFSLLAWFAIISSYAHLRKVFAVLALVAASSAALMLYTSFEGGKIIHREIHGDTGIKQELQKAVPKHDDD